MRIHYLPPQSHVLENNSSEFSDKPFRSKVLSEKLGSNKSLIAIRKRSLHECWKVDTSAKENAKLILANVYRAMIYVHIYMYIIMNIF